MLWRFLHYIFSLNPLLMLNNGKGMIYTVIIYNFPLWLMPPYQLERGDFGALPLERVRIAERGKLLYVGSHPLSWRAWKMWMKQKTEEWDGRKDGFITRAAERWHGELVHHGSLCPTAPIRSLCEFWQFIAAWRVLAGLQFETFPILWQECWPFIVATDAHNRNTIHSVAC